MNLYKELYCPDHEKINQDLMQYIKSQNIQFKEFWNPINVNDLIKCVPSFKRWAQEQNLLISAAAITYATTIDCCRPHTDTPPARIKLSWPIKNTKGSWNRWFTNNSVRPESIVGSWGGKTFHDLSALEEIARREVIGPSLIDAGVIHDVWFDSTNPEWPRIGLQCQLFNEPKKL